MLFQNRIFFKIFEKENYWTYKLSRSKITSNQNFNSDQMEFNLFKTLDPFIIYTLKEIS